MLLYQARAYGLPEAFFAPDCPRNHTEHGPGSRWPPEGAASLFRRLQAGAVPVVTNETLAREARNLGLGVGRRPRPRQYAPPNWGYASAVFEERAFPEGARVRAPDGGSPPAERSAAELDASIRRPSSEGSRDRI